MGLNCSSMKPQVSVEGIRQLVAEYKAADARSRIAIGKRSAFLAATLEADSSNVNPNDLELLIHALELGCRHHSWPGKWRAAQMRLHFMRRNILEISDPVIVEETTRTLPIDIGGLVCKDARATFEQLSDVWPKDPKAAGKAGAYLFISLGGDGRSRVKLRFVRGNDPEVSLKELRQIRRATTPAYVRTLSGRLSVSGGSSAVEINTNCEHLILQAYLCGSGRNTHILVVAAKLTGQPPEYQEAELEDF